MLDIPGAIAAIEERRKSQNEAFDRAIDAMRMIAAGTGEMIPHRHVGRPPGRPRKNIRRLTPEGRQAIVAALKRRWVQAKRQGKTNLATKR